MKKNFDTFEYVIDLGVDLVREFEKAGKTTHPHSVGEGREKSAIDKLKDILPSGIGVGSGFVIDSYGNVSSQCDIVIYEKDLCLKFNAADDRNSYYNCESVIAIGEVKSDLAQKELDDSIKKLKKIKELKRLSNNNRNFRKYLTTLTAYGAESEIYDQNNKPLDQIFTFIICNSFKLNYKSIISALKKIENKYECPNAIISVSGESIGYSRKNGEYFTNEMSAINSDFINYGTTEFAFGQLLDKIFHVIEYGRTTRYNPSVYILKQFKYSIETFPIFDNDVK